MQYVSLLYLLVFLPLILALYQALPQRHRGKLLLTASYFFFFLLSRTLIVYLLFSTVIVHSIGIWLSFCDKTAEQSAAGRAACKKKKQRILWYGIVLNIGVLLVVKYAAFVGKNINFVLEQLNLSAQLPSFSIVVPIGISFFALQAVSYIADVYHQRIPAEEHLGRLALYLAFFSTIMEGPICRYGQTAEALYAGKPLTYHNLTFGAQRILWGVFKKLVIADRLNILVARVFDHSAEYSGVVIVVAAVCYTLQLYADFSGCIDVTIGTGQLFDVTLPENFRQPFFSRTASEFWRRWHITLGTWFKDYIFYPLSLTPLVKSVGKRARKRFGRHLGQIMQTILPLFAVWLANGIWHGVGWHFIFFGMYYFVMILAGNLFEPTAQKLADALRLNRNGIVWRGIQCIKMAAVIVTGELFFRANGLRVGFSMFASIFTGWNIRALYDNTLLQLGLDSMDYAVVAFAVLTVLVVGILHEKGISVRAKIAEQNLPLRWMIYLTAVFSIVIFGAYGEGYLPVDPLYAGF